MSDLTTSNRPTIAETMSPFIDGSWGVRVSAASRLTFTLIDLSGKGRRRNGLASLSLRDPSFQAIVSASRELLIEPDAHASEHVPLIESLLHSLRQRWNGPPVRIKIEQGLPPHTGFGSKTTTLLAVGKAYAVLCGREIPTAELARIAGRGGTSGGSVNLMDRGGFLVDGGRVNPPDIAADLHRYLLPSRFANVPDRMPSPLINLPFPPWPILLIILDGVHLQGEAELEWWRKTMPIPIEEVRKTAHLVLMNLAPAIAEADYEGFCEALNTITFDTYYKQRQIEVHPDSFSTFLRKAARRPDIDAIGMSVHGPACFAMTRHPRSAVQWLSELQVAGKIRSFWFSNAQNHAAVIDTVPIL